MGGWGLTLLRSLGGGDSFLNCRGFAAAKPKAPRSGAKYRHMVAYLQERHCVEGFGENPEGFYEEDFGKIFEFCSEACRIPVERSWGFAGNPRGNE